MATKSTVDDLGVDVKRSMRLIEELDSRSYAVGKRLDALLQSLYDQEQNDARKDILRDISSQKREMLILRHNTLAEAQTISQVVNKLYDYLRNSIGQEAADRIENDISQRAERIQLMSPPPEGPKEVNETSGKKEERTKKDHEHDPQQDDSGSGSLSAAQELTPTSASPETNSNENVHHQQHRSARQIRKRRRSSPAVLDSPRRRNLRSREEPPPQSQRPLKSRKLRQPEKQQEPRYCICNDVYYGNMVGCDNPKCKIEWFHYGCVGLKRSPVGKWFCPDCRR